MTEIAFIPEVIEEMLSGTSKRCPICGEKKGEDNQSWICFDCFQKYRMEGVFAAIEFVERTKAGVAKEEWDQLVGRFAKMISSPEKPSEATDKDFVYTVIPYVNIPAKIVRMALARARRMIEEEKFKKERWESALSQVEEQFPGDIDVSFFMIHRPEFKSGGKVIPPSVMRAACHSIIKKREREREEERKREVEAFVMGFFSVLAPKSVEELVEKPPLDSETQSSGEFVTEPPPPSPDQSGGQIVKKPGKTRKKKGGDSL